MQRRQQEADRPARVTLRPVGAVEEDTCRELRQELADAMAAGFRSIVVDLGAVTKVDVGGLQALAGAQAFLRSRGGDLAVSHAQEDVASSIRINGLDQLLSAPCPLSPPADN